VSELPTTLKAAAAAGSAGRPSSAKDQDRVRPPHPHHPDGQRRRHRRPRRDRGEHPELAAQGQRRLRRRGITFHFDPETDLEPRRHSSLLNFDATVAPGTDLNTPQDQKPPQDSAPHEAERNRVAAQHPGKLVIFYSGGNQLVWTGARWEHRPIGGGGFSGGNLQFVRMAVDASGATNSVPHEIAHYLHLDHTHTEETDPAWQNLEGVKRAIKWWVDEAGHDPADGLGVWDGDKRFGDPSLPPVLDTAPDPGPDRYKDAGLDICDPSQELTVRVDLASGPRDYTFHPDRRNVVSYWDTDCAGGARVTPHQVARIRARRWSAATATT
jgi:hypothetical protein